MTDELSQKRNGRRRWRSHRYNREAYVVKAITRRLFPWQFDSLVSFCFNVGFTAFASSTLLRRVNTGQFDDVPAEFSKWVHCNGREVDGLKRRRRIEIAMFGGRYETT